MYNLKCHIPHYALGVHDETLMGEIGNSGQGACDYDTQGWASKL